MLGKTLSTTQTVSQSVLSLFEKSPANVSIIIQLVAMACGAFNSYHAYLQQKGEEMLAVVRRKKEEQEKRHTEEKALKEMKSCKKSIAQDEVRLKSLAKEEKKRELTRSYLPA